MKKLLVVLGLAMAAFSFQASAATFNLGTVTDFASFSGSFAGTGPFSDTWNFSTPINNGISASLTNAHVGASNKILGFSALLDGVSLLFSSNANHQFLDILLANPLVSHSLVVTGNSAGSYGGSIAVDTTVGAVPVPAAVWLFGSALMGLVGVSRRKSA